MKKTALLNSALSAAVARMGHTDRIVVADCGLPIRGTAERIDLALRKGTPAFMEVLETLLEELHVERAILAEEIRDVSPKMHRSIIEALGRDVEVEYVPHEEFKRLTESTVAVVRTGECTSFANVILQSGVTF